MKVYGYKSKVVTDYPDSGLTKKQKIAKGRLKIAIAGMDTIRALRTFQKSKVFNLETLP